MYERKILESDRRRLDDGFRRGRWWRRCVRQRRGRRGRRGGFRWGCGGLRCIPVTSVRAAAC
jgi:hypothetical protein